MATSTNTNFIPTAEAARLSGYTSDYLSRLCRSGELKAKRVGRSWRIDRSSLEQFMKQQKKRKTELAARTARAREQEYRAAQKNAGPDSIVRPTQGRSVLSPLRIVRRTTVSITVFRTPYAALGVTALALAGGVLLAGSGVVQRSGELVLHGALTARAATIEQLSVVTTIGTERRHELRQQGISAPQVFAGVADVRLKNVSEKTAYTLHSSSPHLSFVSDAYLSAQAIQATYPEPKSAREVYARAVAFTDPTHVRSTLLTLYVRTGEVLYMEGEALGAWYMRTLYQSGDALATLSEKTRDEVRHTSYVMSRAAQQLARSVVETHNNLVVGYVYFAQALPGAIVATLYTTGDIASTVIAQAIYEAPTRATIALDTGFGMFQTVSSTLAVHAYTVGFTARQVTETALFAQELYVRRVVGDVYALMHTNDVYAQVLQGNNSLTASVFSLYQFADNQ